MASREKRKCDDSPVSDSKRQKTGDGSEPSGKIRVSDQYSQHLLVEIAGALFQGVDRLLICVSCSDLWTCSENHDPYTINFFIFQGINSARKLSVDLCVCVLDPDGIVHNLNLIVPIQFKKPI